MGRLKKTKKDRAKDRILIDLTKLIIPKNKKKEKAVK